MVSPKNAENYDELYEVGISKLITARKMKVIEWIQSQIKEDKKWDKYILIVRKHSK